MHMTNKTSLSRYFAHASTGAALGLILITVAIAGTTYTVSQKGKAFPSKKLEISKGDIVSFENDDPFRHNIVIHALGFNSGLMKAGENRVVTFNRAGMFDVRCLIHPKMEMTVVVK